jgi:Meckel syndrome type 1 protein
LLQRSILPAGFLLLGLLLAGCQRASGPEPGVSPAVPASPTAYPDLASVPPRPRLTYSVEQRRAIADALVADREHARYRRAELDYATGSSATPPVPPPPAPPPPAAAPPTAAGPPPGAAAIARQYVEASLNEASDDRDLRDFMKRLDRKIPDPAGPATVVKAVQAVMPGGSEPAAAAPATERVGQVGVDTGETAAPQPSALQRLGSFLGGVLGLESGEAAPATTMAGPAPAPPAAPAAGTAPSPSETPPPRGPEQAVPVLPIGSVVARVPFPAHSTTLAPGAETQLSRAVELARAANAGLRIVAPATDAGLGIDRARSVAVGLMRLGAPASQLDTRTGGPGDEVVVYLAPRRAS